MYARVHVAVALAALLALPAPSAVSDSGTRSSSVVFDGNGSVTWLLNVSGSSSHIVVKANATLHGASLVTIAFWISYAANHTRYDRTWITLYWGDSHASVQLPSPVGKVFSGRVLGGVDGSGADWDETLDLPPGTYRVVAMVAGDGGLAGFASIAAPASAQLQSSMGPAFYARSYDFGSGTNIELKTLVSARYIDNASVEEDTQGRMFSGFHGASISGILDMAVKTPSGELTGDTGYLLTDEPPGTYQFVIQKNIDASPWPCFDEEPLPVCLLPEIWTFGASALI